MSKVEKMAIISPVATRCAALCWAPCPGATEVAGQPCARQIHLLATQIGALLGLGVGVACARLATVGAFGALNSFFGMGLSKYVVFAYQP